MDPGLLGRAQELGRIRDLVRAVAGGSGAGLLVLGEPGAGKTALLEEGVRDPHGVRVLRTRGVDAESRMAFAGLTQLVRPLTADLMEDPDPQAAALRAALALGPPVAADRFAAYAGLLRLLGGAGARHPLVIVVDDAHWLDTPSAEALAFCARRLDDDAVGMILAARTHEGRTLRGLGIPELTLSPLPAREARALVERVAPDLDPAVRDAVLDLSAGNPLALTEIPRRLDADQRSGRRGLEAVSPGEAVVEAFGRAARGLPAESLRALLVVAVGADQPPGTVAAAVVAAGGAPSDLAPARAAGLLEAGDDVRFPHPLVRHAVREVATPADRRAAHRALAAVLTGPGSEEARAVHLAAAAVGPDEEAATALQGAAMSSAARTGYAVAGDLMERAAALSADPEVRARRLLVAGQMHFGAGNPPRAILLLERALADARDPVLRGEVAHMRGVAGMLVEPLDRVLGFMLREAEAVVDADPARAGLILTDAILTRSMGGECLQAAAVARRALAIRGAHPHAPVVTGFLGGALLLSGETEAADRLIRRFADETRDLDPMSPAGHMLVIACTPLAWLGEIEEADRRLQTWIGRAREAGGIGFTGLALAWSSELAFRTGAWERAEADAEESVRLLGETGQGVALGYALTNRARVDAARGRVDEVLALADRADRAAAERGVGSVRTYSGAARGLLWVGLGRMEEAAEAMGDLPAYTDAKGLRHPLVTMWQPDLVEAYLRLGRRRDAVAVLRTLAEQAGRTGEAWSRAVTARCRGMIDPDIDRHFGEALALHARLPMPFETARTRLAYGERLRREGRRTDARRELSAALETFDRLRAHPWAERARDELAASGGRRDPSRDHREELTPREWQIARAVAEGFRNREVAARLLLSEKTVERHLGAVYAKLGVRSRVELTRLMLAGTARGVTGDGSP